MSTVATSTAPAFKAALLATLQADPDLAGVQVQATYPGDTLRAQAMYYGHTIADVTTPVMAGSRIRREERYRVEVLIDVCDGSNDVSKAEGIAHGILGELDDNLAQNAVQGQPVIDAFLLSWDSRPYVDDTRQGWAVLITAEIQVRARLR
jgi:hypothetical protein